MGPGFRRDDRFLWDLRRFGFFFLARLDRAGILALGVGVAVDQLDDRHCRVITVAEPGLQDPGVSARPRGIALGQRRQQLVRETGLLQFCDRLPAAMPPAALSERE